ncbi:transposase [Nostoc sp. KVJ20]|uniref:transposase n=1 Tax=Nostoc sp. KVJ20 TaxID=457944 RepID=UPI00210A1E9C|nr:transposase [Nostoc sp. KVJ20]
MNLLSLLTRRAHSHKVFEGLVEWVKNSVGWHYGFKLHLIINDRGDLFAFKLTLAYATSCTFLVPSNSR